MRCRNRLSEVTVVWEAAVQLFLPLLRQIFSFYFEEARAWHSHQLMTNERSCLEVWDCCELVPLDSLLAKVKVLEF